MSDDIKTLTFCLGGLNPLCWAGCDSESHDDHYDDYDYDSDRCYSPETEAPTIQEGQSIYSKENHYLVSDKPLEDQQAQKVLDDIPIVIDNILNRFGIDSPWRNRMVVRYLDEWNMFSFCGKDENTVGCAKWNGEVAISNTVPILTKSWEVVLYHEISHALRDRVMEPACYKLEEGLANYTAGYASKTASSGVEPVMPEGSRIYLKDGLGLGVSIGESVNLIEELGTYGFYGIRMNNISDKRFEVELNRLTEFTNSSDEVIRVNSETYEIPLGEFLLIPASSLMMYIQKSQRPEKYDILFFELEAVEEMTSSLSCSEDSYKNVLKVIIDGETVPVLIPYQGKDRTFKVDHDYEQFLACEIIKGFADTIPYTTAFCFWELIGMEHVKTFLQSMMEYSKSHQEDSGAFPFIETLGGILGWNVAETRAYFEKFGLDISQIAAFYGYYNLGGVCW